MPLPEYLTPTHEEDLTGEAAAIARKARGMLAIHFPEGFTRFDGASVELHEVDFVVFDKLSAPVILALPPGLWEKGSGYHLSGYAKLGAEGSYAGLPRLAVHPDGESEREIYSFKNASFAVVFIGMQTGEITPGNYFDALVVEAGPA